jgi:hypothetical protein
MGHIRDVEQRLESCLQNVKPDPSCLSCTSVKPENGGRAISTTEWQSDKLSGRSKMCEKHTDWQDPRTQKYPDKVTFVAPVGNLVILSGLHLLDS